LTWVASGGTGRAGQLNVGRGYCDGHVYVASRRHALEDRKRASSVRRISRRGSARGKIGWGRGVLVKSEKLLTK